MKKYNYLFLILFSVQGFSQNNTPKLDSLLNVLRTAKEDTNKVNILVDIGTEFKIAGDPDKSIEHSSSALKLARLLNYKTGVVNSLKSLGDNALNKGDNAIAEKHYSEALKIAKSINYKKIGIIYNNIGLAYFNQAKYPEAFNSYTTALSSNEKTGDKNQLANTYNNIGQYYKELGNYPNSLKNLFACIKLREEIGQTQNISQTFINIGSVYFQLGKYQLALNNYSNALKLSKKSNDKNRIAQSYNGIGLVYRNLGDDQKALQNYYASLKMYEEISYKYGIANVYLNIASMHHSNGDLPKALENYFEGLKIAETSDNKMIVSYFYIGIGKVLIDQKKMDEAKKYLLIGLESSKNLGLKEITATCYLSLSNIDSIQGNFKEAYSNKNLFHTYKNSLVNEENTKKIVQIEMQSDFDRKEAEAKSIQDKKDATAKEQSSLKELQLSRTKYIIIALALLLLLLFTVGLLFFRQKRLKAKQETMQLEQKLLRSQMNPHFIFNSLATIEGVIYEKQPKEAGRYLSDFSRLMRLILENSAEEFISLDKEIKTLEYYLVLQKLRLDDNLTYSIHVDESLDLSQNLIPPMLTQPFIENAIEHGFRGKEQKGHIEISFIKKKELLEVQVIDNGIGINRASQTDEAHSKHKSMALQITRERLLVLNRAKKQKLRFTIDDISDEQKNVTGTKIIFTIPL